MTYADFDYNHYPFVYIKVNAKLPGDEEMQKFFEDFSKIFNMPDKAIVVFNTRDQKLISSNARIQTGHWIKSIESKMKEKVLCIFFVESSMWLQMVLKAIFLVAKPPVPIHVANSYQDAATVLDKNYKIRMVPQKI